MKNIRCQRILAILLAFTMLMSMTLVFTISGSADTQGNRYILKADKIKNFFLFYETNGSLF